MPRSHPPPHLTARLVEALTAQGPYAEVRVCDTCESTNAELLGCAPAAKHLTALLTEFQTGGRGRQHPGEPTPRAWLAPPSSSLLVSVLVRPPAAETFGLQPTGDEADAAPAPGRRAPRSLLSLAFGLAAVQAVDLVLPRGAAELKWPNDVMVAGHKIGGLLAQVAPTGELVVGLGLNVHQSAAELAQIDSTGPPPGSLATVGAPDVDRDWLGIAYLAAAAQLYQRWERAEADLLRLISARVGTIGQEVDIRLPDGGQVRGRAEALAADGTLKVRVAGGQTVSVLGGDLTTAPTSSPGPAPQ